MSSHMITRPEGSRRVPARTWVPVLELMEERALLDSALGTLFGTVYVDPSGTGQFPGGFTPLPGATVQLYRDGESTPFRETTSGADGGYAFSGLGAGVYTIVETPPSGLTFSDSRVASQVYPASGAGSNALRVTVVDPRHVWLDYRGVVDSSYVAMKVQVNGQDITNSVGPFRATLGTSPGGTDLNAGFQTFCLDDLSEISFAGGEQFRVAPRAITDLGNGRGGIVPADRAGRIAGLYNAHGQETLSPIDGAALQLAMWELLYDTSATPDFHAGDFQVVSPLFPNQQAEVDAAIARAIQYFDESAGRVEPALLLDATKWNPPAPAVGYQSMIATQCFDFVNVPSRPVVSSLSGYVYCDLDRDGRLDPTESGIGGVVVTLTGKDASGNDVRIVTQTTSTPDGAGHGAGFYQFVNLAPGTYTITEGAVPGYEHVSQTQGTPGTGVTRTRQFADIVLSPGVNGENNDFGEAKPPVECSSATLLGVHQQERSIVLKLTGDVPPAAATDRSRYTILALGPDEKLGTADDRPIPIRSASYDASTRTVVLTLAEKVNIHYHYLLVARFPGDDCTPPSVCTRVVGRPDLGPIAAHGKVVAPPPLTPHQQAYHQRVANRALAKAARDGDAHGALAQARTALQTAAARAQALKTAALARAAALRRG